MAGRWVEWTPAEERCLSRVRRGCEYDIGDRGALPRCFSPNDLETGAVPNLKVRGVEPHGCDRELPKSAGWALGLKRLPLVRVARRFRRSGRKETNGEACCGAAHAFVNLGGQLGSGGTLKEAVGAICARQEGKDGDEGKG